MNLISKPAVIATFLFSAFIPFFFPGLGSLSMAQERATPSPDKSGTEIFADNVNKGCLTRDWPSDSSVTKEQYCKCYSTSFANRYSVQQLESISIVASRQKDFAQIISLMMLPEAEACMAP